MVMRTLQRKMQKSIFRAPKWLASVLGLPVPSSSADLHSPEKLRTCLSSAGQPHLHPTKQELSSYESWKSGPRAHGWEFPLSDASFRLGVQGRPLLVELKYAHYLRAAIRIGIPAVLFFCGVCWKP